MYKAKFPIGIQDFEVIISEGYTYVDKTEIIYQLITQGKPYFLSRPRRFGKSLLVSTLRALFLGRRDLFKGLWIDGSDWDWREYPVVSLDMSTVNNNSAEAFELDLIRTLNEIAADYNVTLTGVSAANYLENLIKKLSVKQKVVVLIDEYDKPLLDRIEDIDIVKANREILRQFYTILKAEDARLKFVFLTGVTKFAKVSVFSGINNLIDLTMLDQSSALLGYTRHEIETYFSKEIEGLAAKKKLSLQECYAQIKQWYNGYKFSEEGEWIYNPYSILNLLHAKTFKAHWFETGTPSFLINLIRQREFDLSNLEEIKVSAQGFSSFDIEDLPTLSLLYQSGYLTIKAYLPEISAFSLGFPNREVNMAFSESLLTAFATSKTDSNKLLIDISLNLRASTWNTSHFFEIIERLFALIPYDLYVKHEKYFHTLFYLVIKLAGFHIGAEIHTKQGCTDAVLEMQDKIIIFEFKLDESAQKALDQIKQKKYYALYQEKGLPIYLIGINFNAKERAIDDWTVEQI